MNYTCIQGPFHARQLFLDPDYPFTLTFKLHGYHGRYQLGHDNQLVWVDYVQSKG